MKLSGGRGILDTFDPLIARWFRVSFGAPSEVQERVWAELSGNSHVLACAPTGSGKTLAAFLRALDAFAQGRYPARELSVLYVSPLKALNADIRRNLLEPLAALRALFAEEGRAFPSVSVGLRSGDSTEAERRTFLREPPSVLATTPESLALLLNSPRARTRLSTVRLVVLDEIHALAPNKRGAFLMAQLERLVLLSGEFRRIALSATVADPPAVAAYVAGRGSDGRARPVSVVVSAQEKRIDIAVRYPPPLPSPDGRNDPDSVVRWTALADRFIEAIRRNRTTLVFVNSRRHAEKIAFLINERAGEELAWAHHGSLSREVRFSVEERLKRGLLKAVVATSSLELGIDIGSVDEVLLAGTPAGAAATLQRVGRAGHRLGAASAATLFPLHPLDLLFAAAAVADVRGRRLERESRPRAPLDLLAQLVLSMTAMDDWIPNELFRALTRAAPFADLSRSDFDLVLDMLRGRFDDGRLPVLSSRLDRTAPDGILRAKKGVLPLLYASGGVIPDRGSYALVSADAKVPLGELDEEFVWERRIGDGFSLGSRAWRIVGIDDRAVTAVPSDRGIQIVPFWRAENQWRASDSMESVLDLLEEAEASTWPAFSARLEREAGFDEEAAAELGGLFVRQRSLCPVPLRNRLSAEDFSGPDGQGRYSFLHTMRGGRVNAALGIALRGAADRRWGAGSVEFFWEDAGILASFSAAEELSLSGPALFPPLFEDIASLGFARLLAEALEPTGLFGAAFRENAGRALLLPKASFGKRMPLWMTRLRSKRLYEAVRSLPDFPLVRETWRTCLHDILESGAAERLAADLASGAVELVFRSSAAPSPFARGCVWIASGSFMYRGDDGGLPSRTDEETIKDLLAADRTTPGVSAAVAAAVAARAKRLDGDYAPSDAGDAADWLDERLVIDAEEWAVIVARLPAGSAVESDVLRFPGAERSFAASPDLRGRGRDDAALLSHWLRYEGPVSEERVVSLFGPSAADALRALADTQALALLRVGEGPERYCDAEYASRLLRAERTARRAAEAAAGELSLGELQAVAAALQGVAAEHAASPAADADAAVEALRRALEPLLGAALPADLWERDVFPARCDYRPYHLELLISRYRLVCFSAGQGRIGYSFPEELRLADGVQPLPPLSVEAAELRDALRAGGRGASRAVPIQGFSRAAFRELAEAGILGTDKPAAFSSLSEPSAAAPPTKDASLPYGAYRPRAAFPSRAAWQRGRADVPSAEAERWVVLERGDAEDSLERESALRERARRLLCRCGVLCRSIAELDGGHVPWSELFRALRLMEFSGEVVGGRFVAGIEELQFRFADRPLSPTGALYCLCARDPACFAGHPRFSAVFDLPPRLASNHLVWRGGRLLLVSRRLGRELDFRLPPEDPESAAALSFLCRRLARRAVDPVSPFVVERIGAESARRSPYAPLLLASGFAESLKGLEYVADPRAAFGEKG